MQDAEKLFRALADEERLRIVNLLLLNKEGVCVCELVDALRIPQYQVSRQLSVLRDAGLVAGDKRGTWVYYRVPSGLPPLARATLHGLAGHLGPKTGEDDQDRFARRLRLREEGVCVVGYDPGLPFREIITAEEG